MGQAARQIEPARPFTKAPNDVLDFIARRDDLSPTELRVAIFLIRQTHGFHRDSIPKNVTWMARRLDMPRPTASKALHRLIRKGIIDADGDRLSVADFRPECKRTLTPPAAQPYIEKEKKTTARPPMLFSFPSSPTAPEPDAPEAEGADGLAKTETDLEPNPTTSRPDAAAPKPTESRSTTQSRPKSPPPPEVADLLDLVPPDDRAAATGPIRRWAARRGANYVRRAIDYAKFRTPENFPAYLASTLANGWGEDWAEQRDRAAKIAEARLARTAAENEARTEAAADARNDQADAAARMAEILARPDWAEIEAAYKPTMPRLVKRQFSRRGFEAVTVRADFLKWFDGFPPHARAGEASTFLDAGFPHARAGEAGRC